MCKNPVRIDTCKNCKEPFECVRIRSHLCSPRCRYMWSTREYRATREEKKRSRMSGCVACGEMFMPIRETQQFCSRECYQKSRERPTCECQACGVVFKAGTNKAGGRKRYCGSECRTSAQKVRSATRQWMRKRQKEWKRTHPARIWMQCLQKLVREPKTLTIEQQWKNRLSSMAVMNRGREGNTQQRRPTVGIDTTWTATIKKLCRAGNLNAHERMQKAWKDKLASICSNQNRRMLRKRLARLQPRG